MQMCELKKGELRGDSFRRRTVRSTPPPLFIYFPRVNPVLHGVPHKAAVSVWRLGDEHKPIQVISNGSGMAADGSGGRRRV